MIDLTQPEGATRPLFPLAPIAKREIRSTAAREVRVQEEDGKRYFVGYAALFGCLSNDLGGWREKIARGAFAATLAEVRAGRQEVMHVIDHSKARVLGKTSTGTTELWEDEIGLRFKTLINEPGMERSYELDLIRNMQRGDVSECSFQFAKNKDGDRWMKENGADVRELLSVTLYDVSIVSGSPAYPQPTAELSFRSMFPDGVPEEVQERIEAPVAEIKDAAIASHSTATSDKSWDGAANEARLKADQPASYYKKAFAWIDSDTDGTKKSNYKFLHHEVSAAGEVGSASIKACQAIIANLNGARSKPNIPDADRKGVYNHASKHIKDGGGEPAPLKDLADVVFKNDGEECNCACESCVAGNCGNCTNTECDDPNCGCVYSEENDSEENAGEDNMIDIETLRAAQSRAQGVSGIAVKEPIEIRSSVGSDGTLELMLYGDIGESWYGGGITAENLKAQIEAAGSYSQIRMRINSFGGDAFEGITIGNYMRSLGKPVEVYIDGLAASAASIIAMCGHTIVMAGNAMMMIHNSATMAFGYASDLEKTASVLRTLDGSIAQTYVDRTGNSLARCKEMMDGETWMDAARCVQEGFATRVSAPDPAEEERAVFAVAAACAAKLEMRYRNVPEQFKAVIIPAVIVPDNSEAEAAETEELTLRLRLASVA